MPNPTQIMMTLAGLAATGATERPSGETLEQQKQRILTGINNQLGNTQLATGGQWEAIWVGLTRDRANLAYIAKASPSAGGPRAFAVCLRGTVGGSPIDTAEDMNVGTLLPFEAGGKAPGGTQGKISQGAMEAFTELVMGTDLLGTLVAASARTPPDVEGPTIYVTGHSLGGALATTVSLYLAAQSSRWGQFQPSFQVYTFAAPTAGDQAFAQQFAARFPAATCIYNYYDLVPYAWQSLASIYNDPLKKPFYPGPTASPHGPGPTARLDNEIGQLIKGIAGKTKGNQYVQPPQKTALNFPLQNYLPTYPPGSSSMDQFLLQVGFQHSNNNYLNLLAAQPLPSVEPVVQSLKPMSGPATGGTSVTIIPGGGVPFSPDCVVDFGVVPATAVTVAPDGSRITAVSPAGAGIVDVRVTNFYGTSPVVPNAGDLNSNDQFSFLPLGSD